MSERKDEKDEREERDRIEIDFGAGKVGFGGLFKGIGDLFELASRMSGSEEIRREGEFSDASGKTKGYYGFTVRTMGGKPVMESFGNIRETDGGPVVDEIREPMVDVFDEDGHILIVAELPGVAEEGITVKVEEGILHLGASGVERKYAKDLQLPAEVETGEPGFTYKNGILEIRLTKR